MIRTVSGAARADFVASTVITRMRMHCYGHVAHGMSHLYTSVRSLRDLHSFGPLVLGCINSVETSTMVCNLHLTVSLSVLVGSSGI